MQHQGAPHFDERTAELFALLEMNSKLREELAYVHELQSANRKLMDDICSHTILFRRAVLDYRAEQERLDKEFTERTQF
jgi:hypothetical protein